MSSNHPSPRPTPTTPIDARQRRAPRSTGPPPASPSADAGLIAFVRSITPATASPTPHTASSAGPQQTGPAPSAPLAAAAAAVASIASSPAFAAPQTPSTPSKASAAPASRPVPPPTASTPGLAPPAPAPIEPVPAPAPPLPRYTLPPPPLASWTSASVKTYFGGALPDILERDPSDHTRMFNYRSIVCLPQYMHVSFEELRLDHYTRGRLDLPAPPQPQVQQPFQQSQQSPLFKQQAPPPQLLQQQQPHYHWDTPEGREGLSQHFPTNRGITITPTAAPQPVQSSIPDTLQHFTPNVTTGFPTPVSAYVQPLQPVKPAALGFQQQAQQALQQSPQQSFQHLQQQPVLFQAQPSQQPPQQQQQQSQPQPQPQPTYHWDTPEAQRRLSQHFPSNRGITIVPAPAPQPVQPPTPGTLQYLAPNIITGFQTPVSASVQPPQPVQPPAPAGLVILPSGNVCTLADIVEIQKQVMEGLERLHGPAPTDNEVEAGDSGDDERSSSSQPRPKHRHEDKRGSDKLKHRVKRIEKMLDRLLLDSEGTDTPSPSSTKEAASTSAPPKDEPAPLLREAVPQEHNLKDDSSEARTRDDVFSLITLHGEPLVTEQDEPSHRTRDPSAISSTFASIIEFTRCPEVRQFLDRAARFPGLRSTPLFDFSWVLDNLFDVHGGIFMYWLEQSLDLMQTLVSSGFSLEVWDASLLQKIDAVYRDTLRPAIGHDGRPEDELKAAWKTYRNGVLQCLTEYAPSFDAARVRALLPKEPEPFIVPIATASFVHDFNDMWCSVDVALKEIARWFEPFIDYGPDFHRRAPFHDATLTIARHIRADTALADPAQAVALLWTFLRRERACFLAVLRAKVQHAAGAHAAARSQPVLPARDAAPMLRLLDSLPAVRARLLGAAMELRALDATRWAWAEAEADWGVRLAGALREAALVREYRPALLKVPQVEYVRGAVLAACQRSAFWDGLEAGEEA